MPIHYNVIEKKTPFRSKPGRRYYASARSQGELSMRRLSTQIALATGLKSQQVFSVLKKLGHFIPEALENGQIVRIGGLGSLCLSLKSRGETSPAHVTRESIETYRLNFKPAPALRDKLANVKFVKSGYSSRISIDHESPEAA
jgi:predicted histone-like DNA-binding protein